jgi:hypothetical protein
MSDRCRIKKIDVHIFLILFLNIYIILLHDFYLVKITIRYIYEHNVFMSSNCVYLNIF